MVVPGVLFVIAASRRRASETLAGLVGAIDLPPASRVIVIALGIGVVVESLTGSGVSLLVTVPLLLRFTDRTRCMSLALIGMSLMPWGALAISAHVAGGLAGIPVVELTTPIWWLSGCIALILPVLCLVVVGAKQTSPRDVVFAIPAGIVLAGTAGLAGTGIGIETAGVLGGLAVLALGIAASSTRRGLGAALAEPGLRPYLALIVVVLGQKLAIATLVPALGVNPVLSTGRVTFRLLTSPGIPLLIVTLLAMAGSLDLAAVRQMVERSWRALATVLLFMLSARLMLEIGAFAALARQVAQLGQDMAIVATTLLGAASGFITGSGVSANGLFMPGAAAIGQEFGLTRLFAAIQNCSAGHVAMASLPVGAILLAALPDRQRGDDRHLLVTGLWLAALYTALIAAVAIGAARLGVGA